MPNHLIKLLIVEDEEHLRNLIRMTVDWAAMGVQVIGEAATGLEALYMIDERRPDIVLTDIEMPFMDGLELGRQILQRYGSIHVVVLTAHDQFQYAQQALKIGITNYILKPIDPQKIEEAVRAVIQKIIARRARLSKMELSHLYVQNHKRFFRDRALEEMTHKGHSEGLDELLEMVDVDLPRQGKYSLALLSVENSEEPFPGAKKYLMLGNCRAFIEENYTAAPRLWVFWDGMDALTLLSPSPQADLAATCQQIIEDIESSMACRVFVGMGDQAQGIAQLPAVYAQARDAMRLAVLLGKSLYTSSGAAETPPPQRDEQAQDVLLYLRSGNSEQIPEIAGRLLDKYIARQGGDLNAAKLFAVHTLMNAQSELLAAKVPAGALMESIGAYQAKVIEAGSLEEIRHLMGLQMVSFSDIMRQQQQQHSSNIVDGVLRHLAEHYGDAGLSLAALADRFSVNSSYLSRVFKAGTGKPFSEYLIELRINAAAKALEQGDYKAHQLAQMVGIPDPGYFTKCFKKVLGHSFQAYKAQLQRS